MTITDFNNFDGGELQQWGVEVCELGPDKPLLINNQELQTQQWALDTLENSFLLASDASGIPANVIYTVVALPQYGGILINGVNASVGSQFTQEELDQQKITYLNNGVVAESDSFRFDLRNTVGGWNGIYTFSITIKLGPTSVNRFLDSEIQIFPNPTSGFMTVKAENLSSQKIVIELYTIQGQQILTETHKLVGSEFLGKINLQDVGAGIYLLQITEGNRSFHQQIIKQ